MDKEITKMTLRMPSELHSKLTLLADIDDRSLNNYIIRVLEAHVNREDIQKLLPDDMKN